MEMGMVFITYDDICMCLDLVHPKAVYMTVFLKQFLNLSQSQRANETVNSEGSAAALPYLTRLIVFMMQTFRFRFRCRLQLPLSRLLMGWG